MCHLKPIMIKNADGDVGYIDAPARLETRSSYCMHISLTRMTIMMMMTTMMVTMMMMVMRIMMTMRRMMMFEQSIESCRPLI